MKKVNKKQELYDHLHSILFHYINFKDQDLPCAHIAQKSDRAAMTLTDDVWKIITKDGNKLLE
jgi:hypothetical protein